MSERAEEYVNSAMALNQLGRWLQRHYPKVWTEGGQYDEDKILAKMLPGEKGIYVDIGAHHPQECSNTWRFYQRGWRGLLIEPLRDCWDALLLERREDRLCPIAASNVDGFARLRLCRSVSSLRDDWKIDEEGSQPVRTATLKTILNLYQDYDWSKTRLCSIDVEGHEKEVLEGIDWNTFRPEVFVLEYRTYDSKEPGPDVSRNWAGILLGNGYELKHTNGINQIWKRPR